MKFFDYVVQDAKARYGNNRLRLERINSKYCMTIFEGLKAGEGLSFPHHGPFVINEGAIIGKYCTIHLKF